MNTHAPKTTSTALQLQKGNQPFFKKEGEGRESAFFPQDQVQLKAGNNNHTTSPCFGGQTHSTPFFTPSGIQPKLTVGQPNDKYEQEADATAGQVVQKLAEPSVQKAEAPITNNPFNHRSHGESGQRTTNNGQKRTNPARLSLQPKTEEAPEKEGQEQEEALHPNISLAPIGIYRQPVPACRQTNRYPGNLAHELIEDYYQNFINPISAKEFSIPGSGPTGGMGYADFVDLATHAIYEIKTWLGAPVGVPQALNYCLHATMNCGLPPWTPGLFFPYSVIPVNSTTELVAKQYPMYPGVVVYWFRNRRRVRQPSPQPVRIPVWVIVLLLLLLLVLLIIALAEPTPIGELALAYGVILLLIHLGILDEEDSPIAATAITGVEPGAEEPPPPEMENERNGGLRAELSALAAANGDLLERMRNPRSANFNSEDLTRFASLGQEVFNLVNRSGPEDSFWPIVNSALAQVFPLISQARNSAMADQGQGQESTGTENEIS